MSIKVGVHVIKSALSLSSSPESFNHFFFKSQGRDGEVRGETPKQASFLKSELQGRPWLSRASYPSLDGWLDFIYPHGK